MKRIEREIREERNTRKSLIKETEREERNTRKEIFIIKNYN
jgi:hypothetical protein